MTGAADFQRRRRVSRYRGGGDVPLDDVINRARDRARRRGVRLTIEDILTARDVDRS